MADDKTTRSAVKVLRESVEISFLSDEEARIIVDLVEPLIREQIAQEIEASDAAAGLLAVVIADDDPNTVR